jgi:DNA-directed RNA polymerase specialized sigma24 family protein
MESAEARPVLSFYDVLLAKIAGMPAREVVRTLSITEAVVDQRYRDALSRLRSKIEAES